MAKALIMLNLLKESLYNIVVSFKHQASYSKCPRQVNTLQWLFIDVALWWTQVVGWTHYGWTCWRKGDLSWWRKLGFWCGFFSVGEVKTTSPVLHVQRVDSESVRAQRVCELYTNVYYGRNRSWKYIVAGCALAQECGYPLANSLNASRI
jgi:hypothetical protein